MDARRSISYSVLVHFGFFAFVFALMKVGPFPSLFPASEKKTTWIEVVPSRTDVKDDLDKKIVESAKGRLVDQAAKDALLGERTQIVDDQKVVATPKSGVESKGAQTPQKSKPAERNAQRSKPSNIVPMLSDLGIKINPAAKNLPKEQTESPRAEEEGSLTAQVGGDYVKGFKTGDTTLLNTREYVFYGYFQRIRKSLDRAWDQSLKSQLDKYFRRGRQLAADNDYVTQLMVTLNDDGQIIRIQVIGQSGTQDLDEASVKAFNSAGPFPNPPKGLVDKLGQIKIRWDFVVKT